jgi:hypothetical protein
MQVCDKLVRDGMLLRYIVTVISFYYLSIHMDNKIISKYIYLILPILLTALDEVDNIFTVFHKYKGKYNGCTKLFYYQYTDKICDSISYLLLFLFFKLDSILLLFIVYRIIGVILFTFTKNSNWLILFFDFAKEYLLYLFLFGNNYLYLPLFILVKIIFECYYHTIHNENHY